MINRRHAQMLRCPCGYRRLIAPSGLVCERCGARLIPKENVPDWDRLVFENRDRVIHLAQTTTEVVP